MSFIKVQEKPWENLGFHTEDNITDTSSMMESAELQWTVASEQMTTPLHQYIPHYNSIYREDTKGLIGVVNREPVLTQNIEAFGMLDSMLQDHSIKFDTAGCFAKDSLVFASFKIDERYKLVDDDVDHYFVVVNEHLRPDGFITVLNTPIRIICQNTLTAALSNSLGRYRIPSDLTPEVRKKTAERILITAERSIESLQHKADKMLSHKITSENVQTVLDELFPLVESGDELAHQKANERMLETREAFITQCMGADDLSNYRGTFYQLFNAATDFSQHMFSKVDNLYNIDKRMKTIPGFSSDGPHTMVKKLLKMQSQLKAA